MTGLPDLHVGDHVHDREQDPRPMVVVGTPPAQADEYEADDGTTIAEYNLDYPADDDVIEVKFAERTCVDLDHPKSYAYPRSRLRLDEPIHDIDAEDGDEAADSDDTLQPLVHVEHDGDVTLPSWDDADSEEGL